MTCPMADVVNYLIQIPLQPLWIDSLVLRDREDEDYISQTSLEVRTCMWKHPQAHIPAPDRQAEMSNEWWLLSARRQVFWPTRWQCLLVLPGQWVVEFLVFGSYCHTATFSGCFVFICSIQTQFSGSPRNYTRYLRVSASSIEVNSVACKWAPVINFIYYYIFLSLSYV